jgi:parvulin-like peptidyl-prolyl isomerase
LFKAPVNAWAGPSQSGYGWHLIFISKRNIAAEIPFTSIREEVKAKWLEEAKAMQNKKVYDQLSEKYFISREYLKTK